MKESCKSDFCPLIEDLYEDCYCNKFQSQDIENIIYYCGENYKKCSIYLKLCKLKDEKNLELQSMKKANG